jgi:hypothetical protein
LRNYEARLDKYTNQLLGEIRRTETTPINMSDWFDFYGFDIMGDLGFGKSFDMLTTGVKHFFLSSMHANMRLFTVFGHLCWLLPFFKKIPGLNFEFLRFQKWVIKQVHLRMEVRKQTMTLSTLIQSNITGRTNQRCQTYFLSSWMILRPRNPRRIRISSISTVMAIWLWLLEGK